VDRRGPALVALLLFVVLTGVSIALSGSRPALDQGTAPWAVQVVAHLCAVTGGVLLLAGGGEGGRRLGGVVMAATIAMLLIDAMAMAADAGGADIGAGLVRLVCLLAIGMATARLAVTVAADRRAGGPRPGVGR